MAFACGDCKAVQCQGSLLPATRRAQRCQICSEAQEKAKISDYCRNEHAQCRLTHKTKPRRARVASAIAALGSWFRNTKAMPTIRISLVADGSSTHFDQESPPKETPRHAARAKRELKNHQYLVPEHLEQPPHIVGPVAVPLFDVPSQFLLRQRDGRVKFSFLAGDRFLLLRILLCQ